MPHGYAADGSDMWTPPGWKRPDWWTDELDDTHPLARWQIRTPKQAACALYRRKHVVRYSESQARSRAKRKAKAAAGKIAEFTQRLAMLEAERVRLAAIVSKGNCSGALKADGTLYVAFWDVEHDLYRITSVSLPKCRKALARWQHAAIGSVTDAANTQAHPKHSRSPFLV